MLLIKCPLLKVYGVPCFKSGDDDEVARQVNANTAKNEQLSPGDEEEQLEVVYPDLIFFLCIVIYSVPYRNINVVALISLSLIFL